MAYINLSSLVSTWIPSPNGRYRIAPVGLKWIKKDTRIQVGNDVLFHDSARIDGTLTIGDGVRVHDNAVLRSGVTLERGVKIHAGALVCYGSTIKDSSIIGVRAEIGQLCMIGPDALVSQGAVLESHVEVSTESFVDLDVIVPHGFVVDKNDSQHFAKREN